VLRDHSDNDKSIVSILKDRAGEVINKRMQEEAVPGGKEEHLLKHICHNVKKEGGKRVALPKAATALDPSTRDAIKENRSLARVVEQPNPGAPEFWEAFGPHNAVESVPTDGVKGLAEVKLENSRGGGAFMASLDNVSSIDKVFRNGAPRDEASLVWVDKIGDEPFKAQG
jgi:hypothetical protein